MAFDLVVDKVEMRLCFEYLVAMNQRRVTQMLHDRY